MGCILLCMICMPDGSSLLTFDSVVASPGHFCGACDTAPSADAPAPLVHLPSWRGHAPALQPADFRRIRILLPARGGSFCSLVVPARGNQQPCIGLLLSLRHWQRQCGAEPARWWFRGTRCWWGRVVWATGSAGEHCARQQSTAEPSLDLAGKHDVSRQEDEWAGGDAGNARCCGQYPFVVLVVCVGLFLCVCCYLGAYWRLGRAVVALVVWFVFLLLGFIQKVLGKCRKLVWGFRERPFFSSPQAVWKVQEPPPPTPLRFIPLGSGRGGSLPE